MNGYQGRPKEQNGSKANDENRKLFLGGLSWETTEEDIRNYFSKYGAVEMVSVKYDTLTKNPRGFGFITFTNSSVIDSVLADGPHKIRDKIIDPKRAKSRPICKKIFVGGIDGNMAEEDIKKYFSKFGKIEGIELPYDRVKQRRRDFCFIIFDSEEAADAACQQLKQHIGGRDVDIKKAQPQPVAQQMKKGMGDPYGYPYPPGGRGITPSRGRSGPRGPLSDPYAGYDGYGHEGYYSGYPPPAAAPPSAYATPGYNYPPPTGYPPAPPPPSYDYYGTPHPPPADGAVPPATVHHVPPVPPASAPYPGYGAPPPSSHPPPAPASASAHDPNYSHGWNGYPASDPYGYPGPEYAHPPGGHLPLNNSSVPSQSNPGKVGRKNPTSSYHPYAPRAQH